MASGVFGIAFGLLIFVLLVVCMFCIREIYIRRQRTRQLNRLLVASETSQLLIDDTIDSYNVNINNIAYRDDLEHGRLTKGNYVAYCGGKLIDSREHESLIDFSKIDYTTMAIGGPVYTGKVGDECIFERAF